MTGSEHAPDASEVVARDLEYIVEQVGGDLDALAGKRLVVTGGAGFLGYYLVQSVLHRNRNKPSGERTTVVVLDNYVRGMPSWLSDLASDDCLTLVRHDMREPLPKTIGECEYIVHAAGIASPTYYRKHPIETMDANVGGLRALLDYAVSRSGDRRVEGFVFFSSSEIYGDPSPDQIPTAETYRGNVSCTGPRACYDEAKRYGETLCVNFARQHGVPVAMARPFNNYGPGLKISDRRVIPDFARDIFANRDIVLLSDGSATRTFCYAADAVVGYLKVLTRGRPGEPYNVGVEGPEISMRDLADRIADIGRSLFGYTGKVVYGESDETEYLVDNPTRRCPDIGKARGQLGFDPQVGLDEGLVRTMAWYAENRQAADA
jgi:dTDP-glucose 4,6-dehydratase/UDP-glucuronate decarboxylase